MLALHTHLPPDCRVLGIFEDRSISGSRTRTKYTYDAFGKRVTTAGSLLNPFQYTGREWDQETGLYYYRARYYDPQTGRFISGDPIKFLGGINFYAYARNGSPNVGDPSGLCDDSVDVCHAQLRGRLGAVGEQADVPHLWWWISIGNQDYTISGTGFTWDWLNGMTLNISVTPGTQSQTNPKDNLHNPDSQVLFDTRGSHDGFASPEDCPWVLAMLNRALSYPNGRIPYDLIWYNSNAAAYYVGWPYHDQINNVVAPGWRYPSGWNVFLPNVGYEDYHPRH